MPLRLSNVVADGEAKSGAPICTGIVLGGRKTAPENIHDLYSCRLRDPAEIRRTAAENIEVRREH